MKINKKWTKTQLILFYLFVGFLLGVFQKYLDGPYSKWNELFPTIDLSNYFGRFPFWIFVCSFIALHSEKPLDAAIHVCVFLLSMVAGYYLYCFYVLGFLPYNYMKIWILGSFLSGAIAYGIWYGRRHDFIGDLVISLIIGSLFSYSVNLLQGFYLYDTLDICTFVISLFVFIERIKENPKILLYMLVFAFLIQMLNFMC